MTTGHLNGDLEGYEQQAVPAPDSDPVRGPVSSTPDAASLRPLFYFFVPVALLLAARQGDRMSYAYPAFALVFSAWCLRRHPKLYINFTFLLYLLTPLVRRLADLGSQYHDPSPILSAPLLASLVCIVALPAVLSRLPRTALLGMRPFGLALLGVLYGIGIGLLKSSPIDLIRPGLEWTGPIAFAAYCAAQAVEHDVLSWLEKLSIASIVVLNLYGLVQFLNPLPWDVFWLRSFNQGHFQASFGRPEPMQIRLFSMLNSPQTYAAMIALTMPLLLTLRSKVWSLVAVPLSMLCLALTQSRSQFFTVALAMPMLLLAARSKGLLRVGLLSGIVLVALSVGAVSSDMLNKVTDRLDSFSNLSNDESAVSRRLGMALAIKMVITEPFGQGLGFTEGRAYERTDLVSHYGIDSHDFGVVEVGLCFGYLGGSLYLGAFFYLLYQTGRRFFSGSPVSLGLMIAIFSSLASMLTVNLFLSLPGIWLWTAMGCFALGRPQKSYTGWIYRHLVPTVKTSAVPALEGVR